MNWDDYMIYHPEVFGPLNTLPRPEAQGAFRQLMEEKPARIEMLRRLLKANGLDLKTTDASIQDLNDWFLAHLEADPDSPGRLMPVWYSVVNDVALFLGDVIIERCSGLHWELYTWGKRDVSYQRHVIMGFSNVPNPKYNLDIDHLVASYGHRIVAARGSVARYGRQTVRGIEIDVDSAAARQRHREIKTDIFRRWVKEAESQA